METSAHPQSDGAAGGGGGVEPSNINLKLILICLGLVFVGGILLHLVLRAQFDYFVQTKFLADQEASGQQVLPSLSESRTRFPEPRLQISPPLDLKQMVASNDAQLNSYGWVDPKAGIVRIPIDRAMEILSQKGLPTRRGLNDAKAGPSTLQLQQSRPEQYHPQPQKTNENRN
ncbi:MAG: hypothetical protein JWR26_463 [Pedosphaera sp.]|nr:hypothetical protein [Pedosphaera sp.]